MQVLHSLLSNDDRIGRVEPLAIRLPSGKKGPLPSPGLFWEDFVSEKPTRLVDCTVQALAYEPSYATDLLWRCPPSLTRARLLQTRCSSGLSWHCSLCKHVAAVYYLLAEQFDIDPFLIFKLRGKAREEIVENMRSMRVAGAGEESEPYSSNPASLTVDKAMPLEECLDCFWQKGSRLDSLEMNPIGPKVENAVLKRLGDASFTIGHANLAVLLAKAYDIASRSALHKAEGALEESETEVGSEF